MRKNEFSRKIEKVKPSVTLAIGARAKEMKAQGVDVVGLAAGEPDFDTPGHIKEAAITAINDGFTKYTPASGMPELKKAICAKLEKDNGLSYKTNQIVVSCGAKGALFNVFQVLLNGGDEVIIPAPYWLSYPEMVTLAGGKSVFIPTDEASGFKASPKQIEESITEKTKAIIINSPSNPTGAIYSREELKAIRDIVVKHDIFVVSDEIYEKLIYEGKKHVSIASFDDEILKRTVVINGMSKAYAMTGWRLGYSAAPGELAKRVSSLQSHSTSNPTSFAQVGGIEAINKGDEDCGRMLEIYEKRRDLMIKQLEETQKVKFESQNTKHLFDDAMKKGAVESKHIIPFKPEGAFYMFTNISRVGLDSVTFASRLLEEAKVAVVPGAAFGSDKHIRLSFATSEDNIRDGISRISEWLKSF